jgi:hypothetical protein
VGQVCLADTGACTAPECTSDGACGQGRVCTDYACVAGCRADAECPADQRCFSDRCVPRAEACDCAEAPRFCGADLNPLSAGAGNALCLPDDLPAGGVLLFGSVLCSHCQALLDALEALQAEVAPAGDASLVFVQEPDLQVGEQVVGEALAGATVPVLQDSPEVGIWSAYGADWYHVVLLDRNGCLARHWGPLLATDVSGKRHAEMREAWLEARSAPCVPVSPDAVEAIPDATEAAPDATEATPDAAPDTPPDPGPADDGGAPPDTTEASAEPPPEGIPEAAEEVLDGGTDAPSHPDAAADALAEAGGETALEVDAWVEPFALQEVCQVEAGLPTPPGAVVPHFLCQDRNTASVTANGPVSDVTLRELVWIAYFGTCT